MKRQISVIRDGSFQKHSHRQVRTGMNPSAFEAQCHLVGVTVCTVFRGIEKRDSVPCVGISTYYRQSLADISLYLYGKVAIIMCSRRESRSCNVTKQSGGGPKIQNGVLRTPERAPW